MVESYPSHRVPTFDEIEAFLINNEDFDIVSAQLNRFNPIKVMRMERMEIRHSAILSWLLAPTETHGFGEQFLKAFLSEALKGHDPSFHPNALDVVRADLSNAEVRAEWKNIDIFVLCPDQGWAFVIENKFHSRQSDGQLRKYRTWVEKRLGALSFRGVFLTLWDEEPQDKLYVSITYLEVLSLLRRQIGRESTLLAPEILTFLDHYCEVLEEATGMSERQNEMERLARQLYRENKKVIDFIVEHGTRSDFAAAAEILTSSSVEAGENFSANDNEFRFFSVSQMFLTVLPESWYQALGGEAFEWPGCEGWWAGFPVITWFELQSDKVGGGGRVKLVAEVGPVASHSVRKALIEGIKKAGADISSRKISFIKSATEDGRKYSKFLKDNVVEVKDVQNAEEVALAMRTLVKRFEKEFLVVANVLASALDGHGRRA